MAIGSAKKQEKLITTKFNNLSPKILFSKQNLFGERALLTHHCCRWICVTQMTFALPVHQLLKNLLIVLNAVSGVGAVALEFHGQLTLLRRQRFTFHAQVAHLKR